MTEKKAGGTLTNWRFSDGQLHGFIVGDARFRDGDIIHTSLIKEITVETMNTIYKLNPIAQAA